MTLTMPDEWPGFGIEDEDEEDEELDYDIASLAIRAGHVFAGLGAKESG